MFMYIIVLLIKFKVFSVFVCDNGLWIVEVNSLIYIINDVSDGFFCNYMKWILLI